MSIEWDIDLHLEEISADVLARVPVALGKGLEFLRAEVTPKVPVETGNLAGSGAVSVQGSEGELLYPGPYAQVQHFDLSFHHNTGQALYLEQPLVQSAEAVVKVIGDELGGALE
ncbi:MAG TPA: hypothetical protein VN039_08480 [Nitrospira sp.]|nr:hypothetical protein [Nitrospira sp.]